MRTEMLNINIDGLVFVNDFDVVINAEHSKDEVKGRR